MRDDYAGRGARGGYVESAFSQSNPTFASMRASGLLTFNAAPEFALKRMYPSPVRFPFYNPRANSALNT